MSKDGWYLLLIAAAFAEGRGLGGHGVTMSSVIIDLRNDPLGRWVFWAMAGFLVAHWAFAPRWLGSRPDWRSLVGVALGLAVAAFDTFVLHK